MQLLFGSSPPLNLASYTMALIISNEKMNDIMKIVNSYEEFDLLMKVVSETILNEAKKRQISLYVIMYRRWYLLTGLAGIGTIRAGKGTIRAGEGPQLEQARIFKCCLIL